MPCRHLAVSDGCQRRRPGYDVRMLFSAARLVCAAQVKLCHMRTVLLQTLVPGLCVKDPSKRFPHGKSTTATSIAVLISRNTKLVPCLMAVSRAVQDTKY